MSPQKSVQYKLKALLEGKPFGHPLHPVLVHFPIGLFILSLLLDLFRVVFGDNSLVAAAYYAIAGGIVMGLLAIIPGLVDYSAIRADHPARKVATTHMLLNFTVVGLFCINLVLRSNTLAGNTAPALALVLSLIGVGIILYSGYLGGHMVYNDGIAVGRHRRQTDTPAKTICVEADQAGPDGYFAVAPLANLEEGSSLRAEVNGCVMAIVRVKGEVYAFQEFCTHRFGPLSEGAFDGDNIMCPWHRSCFDVRTGKVTQGPAKVDLKTYHVKIDEGQIKVSAPTV